MKTVNGFGIASLILGIVGILLVCFFGIGGLLGLLGLVLGILGLTVLRNAPKGLAIAGLIVSGIASLLSVGWLLIFGLGAVGNNETTISNNNLSGDNNVTVEEIDKTTTIETENKLQSSSDIGVDVAPANDLIDENMYESNDYYDIVEKGSYVNSIGYTHIIHKVKAKKDVSVSSTIIAYDSNNNVIGKSTSDIVLTEGEYNYFEYIFDADISKASFEISATASRDSLFTGARKVVEMENYNHSGDDLYITFKQVGEEIGVFARFKLIFYKNGKIVDTENGYFNVYAENLTGKGTTDIAKIWVFGKDFDSVEYMYEP